MKLKIGGHIYEVIYTIDKNKLDDNGWGMLSKTEGIIYINDQLIQSEKDATLFHEILHVLNNELNEFYVESLAQQLYQVLKDNNLCQVIKKKK